MTATEASGGRKMNMMRWVLGVSLVLVIVAFIAAFFIGRY